MNSYMETWVALPSGFFCISLTGTLSPHREAERTGDPHFEPLFPPGRKERPGRLTEISLVGLLADLVIPGSSEIATWFGLPATVTLYGSILAQWVRPLVRVTAPGVGVTDIMYQTETLICLNARLEWFFVIPTKLDLSIRQDQRLEAYTVTVRAFDKGPALKTTSYFFAWEGQFLREQYIQTTRVTEKGSSGAENIVTYYHYNSRSVMRSRFVDKSIRIGPPGLPISVSISIGVLTFYRDVVNLNDFVSVFLPQKNSEAPFETTTYEHNMDFMVPSKQTVKRGSQSRVLTWEYDNWGNVIYTKDTGGNFGSPDDDIETWARYGNTEALPLNLAYFYAVDPYAETRMITPWIHDRPIVKAVKVNTPILSGTTPGYHCTVTYFDYDDGVGNKSFNQVSEQTTFANRNGSTPITTVYEYDQVTGRLESATNPEGQKTILTYDDHGYLASSTAKDVKDADCTTRDVVRKFGYDSMTGWKSWEKDGRDYVTEYEYDALGRTRKIIYPDDDDIVSDDPTSRDWDPSKGTSTRRDKNPIRTIDFDDALLTTTVTDQLDHIVVYVYDQLGNLSFIRKNHSTPSGNQIIETQLKYDANGNITDIIDPNGKADSTHVAWYTTKFGYDELNRMTRIIYPDETPSETDNPTRITTYDYSRSGERGYVVTVTTDSGKGPYTITQHLDMADRIWREERSYNDVTYYIDTEYDGQGNKISEALYNNSAPAKPIRQTLYYYDSLGRLSDVVFSEETFNENNTLVTTSPHVKYGYDGVGNKTSEQRQMPGNTWHTTTYEYDGLNRLIKSSVPYTQSNHDGTTKATTAVTKVYYDGNGNRVKVIDARENAFEYGYTATNLLQWEKDPLGNVTSYTYDAVGKRTSMTDPRGNATTSIANDYTIWYLYDDLDRLVKGILPDSTPPANPFLDPGDNPVVSLEYDARGNNTSRTEPSGAKITNEYGARNLLKSVTTVGDGKTYKVTYEYDSANNRQSAVDARQKETKYEYDELNRLTKVTYPLLNTESFGYDLFGNKTSYTDGNGHATQYGFTKFDKLTQITDAEKGMTTYQYDRLGNLTFSKDALKRDSHNSYDELNRPVTSTNPAGAMTKYGYDPNGNRSFAIDPKGQVTAYTYDVANRLTALGVTLDGTVLTTIDYAYDAAGYTKTIEQNKGFTSGVMIAYNLDANGNYASDPLGWTWNETKTIRTVGSTTSTRVSYAYDAMGSVTGITYPNDRTVTYTVNALGQVTTIDGFVTLASYDENEGGLLTGLTLANGTSESFTYDANGRLETLVHSKGTDKLVHFKLTYDDANNVLKRYESQSKDNVYDALNRLKTAYVKGPFLAATTAKDLSGGIVEQDFTGQKALGTGQAITGFSLDMSASSLGIKLVNPHLVSRIELVPGTSEHRLRRESIDIFVSDDNSENTYHRVPRDNWTFTKATGGVVVLEFKPALNTAYIKVHCKYDDRTEALGFDPTKATFTQAGGAFIGTMVKVYHLATERTENYTYDAVGNRQSSSYTYEGSDTEEKQTYQYYTNSDRLKTDGKYAFKYDANGNLVEKGTAFTVPGDVVTFTATYGEGVEYWQYDYDALNRLVKVTKSGLTANDQTVVEYIYDPTGLRLMKTKGTATTQYAFDLAGNQIYDTAGGQEHCYAWAFGKTLARVDGDKDSTVKYFFHTDMLGSTVLVTGDGGKIVWTGDVTPFGEKVSGEGSFEGAVRFTGKEYDEDTGLYYFNARWYDPELGRFVEEDPARDGINWHIYCENRPLNLIDPYGTDAQSVLDNIWSWLLGLFGKQTSESQGQQQQGSTSQSGTAGQSSGQTTAQTGSSSGATGVSAGMTPQVMPTSLPPNEVSEVQTALSEMGFTVGLVDGRCGKYTTLAVWKFQVLKGLEPTGVLDESTKQAILESKNSGATRESLLAEFSTSGREDAFRQQIVNGALQLQGVPYVWGGQSLTGCDCSGSVDFSYKAAGAPVGRSTATGYANFIDDRVGTFSTLDGWVLEPGDLVFWKNSSGATTHVQVYLGNLQVGEDHYTDAVLNAGDPLKIRSLAVYIEWMKAPKYNLTPYYGDLIEALFSE